MKRIITLIIAITAVTTAFCREIRGIVVGENGTPLDYVNVVLYRDSIYVTGTVTDTTGAFSLNTDIRGKLTAKISFVGYETYTSAIPNSGNLGTIKLVPTTATLREVVVSVTRPSTHDERQCTRYRHRGQLTRHSRTANDVLTRVPMVVDNGGTLEVFGKGHPKSISTDAR